MSEVSSGPLAGVRVVELGRFITAPYAAMLLADLGADVVKVESLTGDPFRQWSMSLYSPRFRAYNEAKRSVAVDLRSEAGHGVVHRLVAGADVFIHNVRPVVVQEMSLNYANIAQGNPRLIYCSVRGFSGPDDEPALPVFDAVGQAVTGLMGLLTPAGSPQPVGPALSDLVTGIFAAHGVVAALYERAQTGRGQEVSVAMVDATLALVAEAIAYFQATGVEPDYLSRARNSQAFGLTGSDGRTSVIQLSTPDRFWALLVVAIGRPDLAQDSRFMTYDSRVQNYEQLRQELQKSAVLKTRDEWLALLVEAGVPCGPVVSVAELSEKQVQRFPDQSYRRNEDQHDEQGGSGHQAFEMGRVGPGTGRHRLPPPHLGGDSRSVLADAGFGADEIRQLVAEGIVADGVVPREREN